MGACPSCLLCDSEARRVFERFRVQRHVKFGEGAFGATFLAYDLEAEGQRVAAKRVRLLDSTAEAVRREVEIMGSLSHPNVVLLLASCGADDGFWIFMELLDGGDLFEQVQQLGVFSEARAAGHVRQLMNGLAYCHAHGVVHRDVKLENLMLTRDGSLKIIDFGLAWRFRRRPPPRPPSPPPHAAAAATTTTTATAAATTATTTAAAVDDGARGARHESEQLDVADEYEVEPLFAVCGSRAYCAPEVLRRSAGGYGSKADVYSCGVVLFAMLAGFFPLEEASLDDWRYVKLRDAQAAGMDTVGTVLQWYGRANSLSDHVSDLLHAMLRVRSADRPTAAQVLQHAFLREAPGLMGPHGAPTYRGIEKQLARQLEPARSYMRRLTGHSLSQHLGTLLEGRRSPAEVLEASGKVLLPRALTEPDRRAPSPLPARLPVYRAATLNYLRGAGNGERLPVYAPDVVQQQMKDVVGRHGLPVPPPLARCKRFGPPARAGGGGHAGGGGGCGV